MTVCARVRCRSLSKKRSATVFCGYLQNRKRHTSVLRVSSAERRHRRSAALFLLRHRGRVWRRPLKKQEHGGVASCETAAGSATILLGAHSGAASPGAYVLQCG